MWMIYAMQFGKWRYLGNAPDDLEAAFNVKVMRKHYDHVWAWPLFSPSDALF